MVNKSKETQFTIDHSPHNPSVTDVEILSRIKEVWLVTGGSASSVKTMKILLIIACIGAPLVATYTSFLFWTFKEKVVPDNTSY